MGEYNYCKNDVEECIKKMAYELWEKGGRNQGRDLDYWLIAEKSIKVPNNKFTTPKIGQQDSTRMKNLTGIFFLILFLSGCMITASSGTRTEYEDKMKIIEKDYKENKITEAEYIRLKKQASQQGKVVQENSPMSSGQGSLGN